MRDDLQPLPGFRLQTLEVLNWGTFDGTRGGSGTVHIVRPNGSTTLLIGENGSGKSTLVDALLTLLVRPVVRNYNVAAGGQKQDRDERSYIKGAFDRRSRGDDGHAETQYLRPDGKHYSVVLATFRNENAAAFTLAQVLYLNSEGAVEKVYCFAPGEKSIKSDCGDLATTERVRQELQRRGFRATTTYTEYFGWLQKHTGIRAKAMDMFNQTVAVKDIRSLNQFIRDHMLESKPWGERFEALQAHFAQLTQAHEALVRVRRQFELLEPVVQKGDIYRVKARELADAQALLNATVPFFRAKWIEVFEPAIGAFELDLSELSAEKGRLSGELARLRDEERHLKNEIEHSGGERLRQIPLQIDMHRSERKGKLENWSRFEVALRDSAVKMTVADDAGLARLREALPSQLALLNSSVLTLKGEHERLVLDRGEMNRQIAEDKRELQALSQRQTKLPEAFAEIRRQLCDDLRLPESDLPFASELIAIPTSEREWEASIEMVLRSFALSLLVPEQHYRIVSSYINRTRIHDERGRGQRLVYLRVGERSAPSRQRPVTHSQSLLKKLEYRERHALLPWVKGELEDRFDYRCCDTIEDFHQVHDLAMTKERHLKAGRTRHEKDDRDRTADPRNFVLGWDNREKCRHLASEIKRLEGAVTNLDSKVKGIEGELSRCDSRRTAFQHLASIASFASIDYAAEERIIAALEAEKAALEEASDALKALRTRLEENQRLQAEHETKKDGLISQTTVVEQHLTTARKLVADARSEFQVWEKSGELAVHKECFPALDALLGTEPVTIYDVVQRERPFKDTRQSVVDRLRGELDPLQRDVTRPMNHYLREFPDEKADLEATIEYLEQFIAIFNHIKRDDLPRHEKRFKERLNEKVLHEILLLNGDFQTEKTEIERKIDLLNQSLGQLEYRPGTSMRLEARPVRDPEVTGFQTSLRECLADTFEGSPEADEARFVRIAKLLQKLREEDRWREKVTDVRGWFDFAARESERATGLERGCYEDSAGQSGGEKAKLAFTILVAAIAYQYNLDPTQPLSDRFHFVVVDEMFAKVGDAYADYALQLFKKFGLQLLIVAPLDAKARITEPYVECYLHVAKDPSTNHSEIYTMTAREFEEAVLAHVEFPKKRVAVT